MEHLIVANSNGTELRNLVFESYDFEVGTDENSFQIVINRREYTTIPDGARLYIPDTEYGGLFRQLETSTEFDTISPGGMTWRGMMQKKIIEPESGADYAYDSGELNAIIKARVEDAFPDLFVGVSDSTGISVSSYQYDRYCTLHDGLSALLKSVGYRLDISYDQTEAAVVVQAVEIVDYSSEIELSSDMRTNYHMQMQGDGVNHLICLGTGELSNRLVVDLYVDASGNISTTQYYTGIDEVAAVYDYAGAEESDLTQSGIERLKELANANKFEMKLDSGTEIAVGDIVGGRDYLSGMTMTAPVTGKIVTWKDGFQKIEYKLSDDVTVS